MKRLAIALLAIILLFGCTVPKKPSGNGTDNNAAVKPPIGVDLMKNVVEKGDTVKADYIGTFVDGNKFDSSIDRKEPLEFVAGAGQMIKGFDAAVIGMKLNDEKNITLQPKDAYGEKNESLIKQVPKSNLIEQNILPEVGMTLFANGQEIEVTAVDENTVTLDFNNKMAGKTLNFWLKVVGITKKRA